MLSSYSTVRFVQQQISCGCTTYQDVFGKHAARLKSLVEHDTQCRLLQEASDAFKAHEDSERQKEEAEILEDAERSSKVT